MSGYVGANAPLLTDLRSAAVSTADELALRRRRLAALCAEAGGDAAGVGAGLAAVEEGLQAAACEIGAAAQLAATHAAEGGQTGWRASLGMVDDVLLDALWVNDLHRIFTGRDINTGTEVGPGGRAASAVFLIPFTKLAKAAKLLKLGDDAAEVSARVASRSAVASARNADEVRSVLAALPAGSSRRVRTTATVAELDDLFTTLSREGRPVLVSHGGPSVLLPDGTQVSRRATSSSGGPTIDIRIPTTGRAEVHKVHVSPWPPR